MNVTGIIAEYNPLHSGHRYHIERSRKETGADYIIAVMSGDYVQRGEPAVLDKHTRARMALLSGADLVLELPFPFCCSSAEDFAASGTGVLDALGVTDTLSFGSESGDLENMKKAARFLAREPEEFRLALKDALAAGQSFPAARQTALSQVLGTDADRKNKDQVPGADSLGKPQVPGADSLGKPQIPGPNSLGKPQIPGTGSLSDSGFLAQPNNILGIEYLKALRRLDSRIRPFTISRAGSGYHESSVEEGAFASATALRRLLREGDLSGLKNQVPPEILPLFSQGHFLFPEDCSQILNYAILMAQPGGYVRFNGFSKELSDRLACQAADGGSWNERILRLKTRNYTYTRISRALLSLMLNLTKEEADSWKDDFGPAPFTRILGFRRTAAPLLSAVKKHSSIPIIAKAADAEKLLPPKTAVMFRRGMEASQIRSSILAGKYGLSPVNEYRRPIQIL